MIWKLSSWDGVVWGDPIKTLLEWQVWRGSLLWYIHRGKIICVMSIQPRSIMATISIRVANDIKRDKFGGVSSEGCMLTWLACWAVPDLTRQRYVLHRNYPYPDGVAIEWLWSADGVYYFHRPECTLQCHSDLMEWYWSGIGVRRKYAN